MTIVSPILIHIKLMIENPKYIKPKYLNIFGTLLPTVSSKNEYYLLSPYTLCTV